MLDAIFPPMSQSSKLGERGYTKRYELPLRKGLTDALQ
jgi:hypothetical protein